MKFGKGYHDVIETLSLLEQNALLLFLSSDEFLPWFTKSVLLILCFRYHGAVEVTNENGDSFGSYCGYRNGQVVVVNGSLVVLRFRSGYYGSYGRFRLLFTPANRKYNIKIYLKS